MGRAGISSNLMSLGGLAFSVGMVVDASIVIVENMRRHFGERREPELRRHIAIEAIGEVARPVAFSVLIIVIVMIPLFSLQGIEGKMFAPLARDDDHRDPRLARRGADHRAGASRRCCCGRPGEGVPHRPAASTAATCALLDGARRARWATLALSAAILVVAGFAATRIGTEFIPNLDEGAIAINVVRLPNASLDGSVSVGSFMERRLRETFPEVTAVVSKTGRAEISEDPMGPEQTDLLIMLKPRKEWTTVEDQAGAGRRDAARARQDPGRAALLLAADRAAGQRADLRASRAISP